MDNRMALADDTLEERVTQLEVDVEELRRKLEIVETRLRHHAEDPERHLDKPPA
jgi:hypothetical protein